MARYSTQETCKIVGISKSTLFQWFKDGKVKDVRRDHRGWRVFTEEDISRLKEFKHTQQIISNQFTGIERRHFTRKKVSLPLSFSIREIPNQQGQNVNPATTLDIGGGGLRILCKNNVQLEQFIDISFSFPPPFGKVDLVGQVRWIDVHQEQEKHLVGCHFVSLHGNERRKVMEFLFGNTVT